MALSQVPNHTTLRDEQFIQVNGPDGLTTGYQFDAQLRALYLKESQVIFPSFHGATHIAEDPVPAATCDTPGLMSADDKCKLDALLQTRVGVLGFQGAGFCVLPNCRVLMADGSHEAIENLRDGDVVIAKSGLPKPITKIHQRSFDGEIVEINCRRHAVGGLKLTPEHKVLAIQTKDVRCIHPDCTKRSHLPCRHNSRHCDGCEFEGVARATPKWVKAGDIVPGDFIVSTFGSKVVAPLDSINPTDYIECRERNGRLYPVAKVNHVYGRERTEFKRLNTAAVKHTLPTKVKLCGDFLRLCGYYLAEGYANRKRLGFAIHSNEMVDGDIGHEIVRIMKELFDIEPTIATKEDNDGIELIYNHSLLSKLLGKILGHGSKHKIIPRFMMELPAALQRQLLIGLFQGDGHAKDAKSGMIISLSLVNQRLVEQAVSLLERCGGKPSLVSPKTKIKSEKFKRAGSSDISTIYTTTVQAETVKWLWSGMGKKAKDKERNFTLDLVQGDYQLDQVRSVKKCSYTGPVHDLTVADDHSYVVNGLVIHNSDDGGWLQGDIILAAGTEFISLERIGNVVRFTVDSPVPLNCACFLPGARVLMGDGTTKAIEDVRNGDRVVTHKGNVRKVKQLFTTPHDGPVYRWRADKHSGEGFAVTGNHPIMALKREYAFMPSGKARKGIKERPDWTDARELGAGDLVSRRRSRDLVEDVETIDVLETLGKGFTERDGLIYSCRTDGLRAGQVDGLSHGIPRFLPVSGDLLDLIGYYAAEGCASRKNGLRFTVHSEEMKFGDIGAEICRILPTLFGLEAKINGRATPNARDLQIFSVPLVELFRRWFSGTKKDKRFPEWVMNLPAAKQARVVAAMFRGDGYITRTSKNTQFTMGLACRNLIDQCLWMAERCGWEPSNPEPKVHGSRIRYCMMISASSAPNLCDLLGVGCVTKKLSRERRVEGRTLHRIAEWSETHYQGTVHNFEVEGDNSYIVDGIEVHNCEECNQIFWVQDETDVSAVRLPTCGGKMPGVNSYGEIKVYLLPESTLVDPNNPSVTLNKKDNYPAFIFKRYDDSITPNTGELEIVLKRNATNKRQTEIGWAFTPGAAGVAQCVWFMGRDNDGNQIRFELDSEAEPGLMGSLLYKGHLLTKKMAVIVNYTSTILSTNQYTVREWNTDGQKAVGEPFTAKNVWQYANPENPTSGRNPKTLLLDSTIDLLPIGTLVEMWFFKVGEVAGEPIRRRYFSKKPTLNPNHIWTWVGQIQFGDVVIAREEVLTGEGSEDAIAAVQVPALRDFETNTWGLTGQDDPLLVFDIASTAGTEEAEVNKQHRAILDTTLPGLKVESATNVLDDFSERPVMLWHRQPLCNALVRADIGRPTTSDFVPYDIILRSPIDKFTTKYMKVVGKGIINGLYYVKVAGAHFPDLPAFGTVRVLYPSDNQNFVYNYNKKFVFPTIAGLDFLEMTGGVLTGGTEPTGGYVSDPTNQSVDTLVLAGGSDNNIPYPGDVGDIIELLHQEYNCTVVRIEFSHNSSTGLVEAQFKVGTLDMGLEYEEDMITSNTDDYVRGLAPGYAVSAIYSQSAPFSGVGSQPDASPEGFVVYDGGAQVGGTLSEYWNTVEVMLRDNQVWIWWNKLLIPPSSTLSQALPTPTIIDTPYFPIEQDAARQFGKVGMRLWPGATVRRFDVRTQITLYNEFQYGQIEIT